MLQDDEYINPNSENEEDKRSIKRQKLESDAPSTESSSNNTSNNASLPFPYEPVIYLKPYHEELFNKLKLNLIIPNLLSLESSKNLRTWAPPLLLYLLMENGRRFQNNKLEVCCFALESAEKEIIGLLQVFSAEKVYDEKIRDFIDSRYLPFNENQLNKDISSKKEMVSEIYNLFVDEKLKSPSDYKKLLLLEVLRQLQKLKIDIVIASTSDRTTENYSILTELSFSHQSSTHLHQLYFNYNDEKQIAKLSKIAENLNKEILNEINTFTDDISVEKKDIKNIPVSTIKYTSKSVFPHRYPTPILKIFSDIEEYGWRLFIPQPDQLMPVTNLYKDWHIQYNYIRTLLNKGSIKNQDRHYIVIGVQDIASDKIVAAIFFWFDHQLSQSWIESLEVDSDYRGKGLASLLVLVVLHQLKMQNCHDVYLQPSHLKEGHKTYCHCGFMPHGIQYTSSDSDSDPSDDDSSDLNRDEIYNWYELSLENQLKHCNKISSIEYFGINLQDPKILKLLDDRLDSLKEKLQKTTKISVPANRR